MVLYVCEDSTEGILCGVYDAWASRLGHDRVGLALAGAYNYEMFTEYRPVLADRAKAQKVERAVRGKISERAWRWVYRATLSREKEKADAVYRFLIHGFHIGEAVTQCLQIPQVHALFALNRAVACEAHHQKEFLRFSQLPDRVLFARIGPKHDVTPLLMPYFCDRMPSERFVIWDAGHERAGVHVKGGLWYLLAGREAARAAALEKETDAGRYALLWQIFFDSVAIPERKNEACQRTHLPLRYRPYMTERFSRS